METATLDGVSDERSYVLASDFLGEGMSMLPREINAFGAIFLPLRRGHLRPPKGQTHHWWAIPSKSIR